MTFVNIRFLKNGNIKYLPVTHVSQYVIVTNRNNRNWKFNFLLFTEYVFVLHIEMSMDLYLTQYQDNFNTYDYKHVKQNRKFPICSQCHQWLITLSHHEVYHLL